MPTPLPWFFCLLAFGTASQYGIGMIYHKTYFCIFQSAYAAKWKCQIVLGFGCCFLSIIIYVSGLLWSKCLELDRSHQLCFCDSWWMYSIIEILTFFYRGKFRSNCLYRKFSLMCSRSWCWFLPVKSRSETLADAMVIMWLFAKFLQ